ncbi:hypothetical protein V8G54_005899 [Vigna mungo]|uniref:PB1-like domain-containing protein n=1 Tax=Vigna mungo TaxID=3915 RepID=A0AAQ3P179_VIGMU
MRLYADFEHRCFNRLTLCEVLSTCPVGVKVGRINLMWAFELRDWSKGCYLEVGCESQSPSTCIVSSWCGFSWKDDIEVVIHHVGKLVNEGCLKYEEESDTMYFDPDLWSYFVVVSVVKGLGYDGFKDLWYSVGCGPVLDDKLEALCDDVRAMHMVNLARLNGQVHLYVVHTVFEPDVIHMIEYNVDEGGEEIAPKMHEGGECAVLDKRIEEDDGGAIDDGVCLRQSLGDSGVTKQLDEGVGGDGERIEVDVGEGDNIEVDVGEGDNIEVDVGEGEKIEVNEGHVEGDIVEVNEGDDVKGKRIEDDEAHDERTKAYNVEETIEVDEAHDERTEANDVEETIVVDEAHDERTKVNHIEETIVVDEAHDERTKVNDVKGETMEVVEAHDERT